MKRRTFKTTYDHSLLELQCLHIQPTLEFQFDSSLHVGRQAPRKNMISSDLSQISIAKVIRMRKWTPVKMLLLLILIGYSKSDWSVRQNCTGENLILAFHCKVMPKTGFRYFGKGETCNSTEV